MLLNFCLCLPVKTHEFLHVVMLYSKKSIQGLHKYCHLIQGEMIEFDMTFAKFLSFFD